MLFDAAALDKELKNVIPAGDTNAVVLDVNTDGTKIAIYATKGEHWVVKGIYDHEWNGHDSLAGQVAYHW